MKTSVLVSGIAALYLAIGVTGMSRHLNEDEMNFTSGNEISLTSFNTATMLPGVTITADRINNSDITSAVANTTDYSYLKFDVNKYMEAEASDPDESIEMPETPTADYSYLKFDVNEFTKDSESVNEITELPETEIGNETISSELSIDNFGYLKFDVNKYIESSESKSDDFGELPASEISNTIVLSPVSVEAPAKDYNYLKFDVTKYYCSGEMDNDAQIELPEK
jgi:hypothetical protein